MPTKTKRDLHKFLPSAAKIARAKKEGARREKAIQDLALMVDVFCACIETETTPMHGGELHRLALTTLNRIGYESSREKRTLPPVFQTE